MSGVETVADQAEVRAREPREALGLRLPVETVVWEGLAPVES